MDKIGTITRWIAHGLLALGLPVIAMTYFNLTTIAPWMGRASEDRYPRKLWEALRHDLAVTTAGDSIHDTRDELLHFMTKEARDHYRDLQAEYEKLEKELKDSK